MIIKALTDFYDKLIETGSPALPPMGWQKMYVSGCIVLNKNGEVLRIVDYSDKGALFMPYPLEPRTSGIVPRFLADNSRYNLKMLPKKIASDSKLNAKFEANAKYCHLILDKCSDVPEAKALLAFYDTWDADKHTFTNDEIAIIKADGNFTFAFDFDLDGTLTDVTSVEAIVKAWNDYFTAWANEGDYFDITTGTDHVSYQEKHPQFSKGSIPGMDNSSPLLSFNDSAFISYRLTNDEMGRFDIKKSGLNASIGKLTAYKYYSALSLMLSDKAYQAIFPSSKPNPMAVISWAVNANPSYNRLLAESIEGQNNEDKIEEADFQRMIQSLARGQMVSFDGNNISPNEKMCILGLSSNGGRIVVEFYHENSLGGFEQNVKKHYTDICVSTPRMKEGTAHLYPMLRASLNPGDSEAKIPLALISASMESILYGYPYPAELYQKVMMYLRKKISAGVKTEAGDTGSYIKTFDFLNELCVIKGYLKRFQGYSQAQKEEITMSLNKDASSLAYQLGRLFAVFVLLQRKSSPKVQVTIENRFFIAASSTPALAFPQIRTLAIAHLDKLEKADEKGPGLRCWYEKQIREIEGKINEFPRVLSIIDQGQFILGYDHQITHMFTKGNANLADGGAEGQESDDI